MSLRTIEAMIGDASERLREAGIEDPRHEARVLLAHVLGRDRSWLHAYADTVVEAGTAGRFETLLAQRCARKPMAQVLGEREFWSLSFEVSEATLTPRPETESLIEAALDIGARRTSPNRILDLGTGSGCLLVTLLTLWPAATGLGIDRSSGALDVARRNARRHGVADRASFAEGDWLEGLVGPFDLVVSNPPYVFSDDMAGLDPEVVAHEPREALDGGSDGLDEFRIIFSGIMGVLAPGGRLVVEHGEGQGDAIGELAGLAGLVVERRLHDLAGRDRCLVLRARTN